MDTLLASAEVDVRNQCVRTDLSSLVDTFFERNVNSIDMNKFRDRIVMPLCRKYWKSQKMFNLK
ncbi:molecular chaperone [Escherichia coli]|nr:molecular chaperone [Escherichia coli]